MKIEYRFNPPIYSALNISLPLVDIYLILHIKSLLLYGGKLAPPVAGEREKNTVAGLRVNSLECTQRSDKKYFRAKIHELESSIQVKPGRQHDDDDCGWA